MELILETLERGVDVNFLLSQNYQDYNKLYQQVGTNSDAVKWIKKRWKKLSAKKTRSAVEAIVELQKDMVKPAGQEKRVFIFPNLK